MGKECPSFSCRADECVVIVAAVDATELVVAVAVVVAVVVDDGAAVHLPSVQVNRQILEELPRVASDCVGRRRRRRCAVERPPELVVR